MADNKVNFLRGTSAEYEASTKDNDTFYYTTDTKKLYLGDTEITSDGVTIDDTLSDTSEHPVQNKVITNVLNTKANLTDIPTTLPANGGNADTAIYQRQAYLGSGIDILDYVINNVPDMSTYLCGVTNCPTCPTNYGYDADNNDFYYRINRYTPTYAVVKAYDINSNNEFMNTLSNGVWTGWNKCSDKGNAATVNGLTVQTAVPANAKFTDTTYDAATASAAGLVSTGAQTFAGNKTFNGQILPAGASDIAVAQARKIYAGTTDMTAGTTALETGAIYLVFE